MGELGGVAARRGVGEGCHSHLVMTCELAFFPFVFLAASLSLTYGPLILAVYWPGVATLSHFTPPPPLSCVMGGLK